MKQKIKSPKNINGMYYVKTMETFCVSCMNKVVRKKSFVKNQGGGRLEMNHVKFKKCLF